MSAVSCMSLPGGAHVTPHPRRPPRGATSTMGIRGTTIFLSLLASLGGLAPEMRAQPQAPQPVDKAGFLRQVREAVRQDDERVNRFIYTERRRDVRVSMFGKVTVGPERTFEVSPSATPREPYKRLIAVDGKPLGAQELAKREADRQRDLAEKAKREAKESPAARRSRLAEEAAEAAEQESIIDDAFAVFEATLAGRETIDGAPVVVADLTPRQDADVKTREGRWMKHFAGRIWIDETTHQIARLDMRALDDISIGWGIVGRIHEKTRVVATRRRSGEGWVPAELVVDASGRTLMFRSFEVRMVTTYSDYRQSTVGSR